MSDIVEDLMMRRADGTLFNPSGPTAANTITSLTAEIDLLAILATDREEYLQLLTDENNKLRAVLQRVRQWGSPMIRGYIDGALGKQAGGSDPLADEQVGENRELEAQA